MNFTDQMGPAWKWGWEPYELADFQMPRYILAERRESRPKRLPAPDLRKSNNFKILENLQGYLIPTASDFKNLMKPIVFQK